MSYVKRARRPTKKLAAAMADVERGVRSKRWIWRLSTITAFFWDIINVIGVFFETMFSMEKSDFYRTGPGGGSEDGGDPRGAPQGLDNVRKFDHHIQGRTYIGRRTIRYSAKGTFM